MRMQLISSAPSSSSREAEDSRLDALTESNSVDTITCTPQRSVLTLKSSKMTSTPLSSGRVLRAKRRAWRPETHGMSSASLYI